MIDLVSERVGGRVVECNDEFFADASNLIKPAAPVWKEDTYTDRGKWMDGWETRRRREPGYDWCVLSLGIPGLIRRVSVDTSYFTGNYPEEFSLDASGGGEVWSEVIPKTALQGDSVGVFDVAYPHRVTRIRLNIYPDGGIARLRVEGVPVPDIGSVCPDGPIDLVAAGIGGQWLAASDYHYSSPSNLLLPTDSAGMWDGWETRRRRGPGHDWATFRLGLPGMIHSVVVDTTHFKGNSPGWVSVEVSEDGGDWRTVADRVAVEANAGNEVSLTNATHAGYVRLSLHPDGGVARLRVMGRPDRDAAGGARLRYLNSLSDEPLRGFFHTACAATRWVAAMMAGRPYPSVHGVLDRATGIFGTLDEFDWLEAFAGHPRIGERGGEMENREQARTSTASREILRDLVEVNRRYEERFGFTYIVYATGKTAPEMLAIARERLQNERSQEIATAAREQRKITVTRLRRMLCQEVE
ncbi:MAG TPA: allantoicase [Acidimicrobiia bacterium]|nr:allantoicase [Acidimicrobiia bacterium]